MITVEQYIKLSAAYNKCVDIAGAALNDISKGHINAIGLVDEETRLSDEYRTALAKLNFSFNLMKQFNRTVPDGIKRAASRMRRQQIINEQQLKQLSK